MTTKTQDFLSQFRDAPKRIAKWPKWMQREARTASASFPRNSTNSKATTTP